MVLNALENKIIFIKMNTDFFLFSYKMCYYYFVLYIQNMYFFPKFTIVIAAVVIGAAFGPWYSFIQIVLKFKNSGS